MPFAQIAAKFVPMHWHLKSWADLSKEELYACLALRIRVFVIEQQCPYQDADGKDRHSHHLFALSGETCVATLRLVHPGVSYPEWSIGRVASDPQHRMTGLGRALMVRAMQWLREEQGNPSVRISAQQYLKKFYEDHGFIQVSEPYLEDNIPHIEMLYSS